nr:serine/threonine-protein phosphatase 7 long form like [Quercus suber]
MDDPSDTIVEIREELMVSSTGGNPTLRIAHFLTPTIKGPVFNLPPFPPSSIPPYIEPHKKLPLRVSFWGWRYPRDNWKTWVEKMATLHETTWKKAGIYEAVLSSTYEIVRDNDLVFGVAEKWCSETNTFIFPWGEVTITLEDTMVLGGYSVLGDSVLCSVDCKELKETEERLEEARIEIARTIRKKADKALWMKKFMDSGSEVEHEAFLACWLSRYVFITTSDSISKHLFPIAIQLARGTRIALAPAVLASIYRDLSLFKEKMIASAKLVPCKDDEDGVLQLTIFSPFHLVQIWAWERFLELRPNPNVINYGEPRIARWNKVISHEVENVRLALDSAAESFQWRPYTLTVNDCKFHKLYAEKEKYISVGPGLDEELQSFARCLRVAELVGLGCTEQYLPHRVAMQFGMDQDLPVCVPQLDGTPEIAWNHYSKPACNMKLYVPPRLFEADVTVRYLERWKQSILGQNDASNGAVQQQREPRGLKRPSKSSNKQPKKLKGKRKFNDLHVIPGFSPKFNRVGMENCNDEDGLTIAERMKFTDKRKKIANSQGKQHGEAGNSFSHCKCLSSSTSDYGPFRKLWKKDVAKGVAACQRDSNCSKQSSKNSKGHMSGNDASVPPGFPPKCNWVHIEDSDEEDKLTVKELLRSCDINSGVGNGISGNGKPLSDLHITPGFSPKFNWVGVENCNDEDGPTIAEWMKFTDKRKKFANSQGKQHGEAGNSFSHCKCLSSSTSDYGPFRKLWKKDVAKGVADWHMSGNDASVPSGFPPKCNRVRIEDSDEEDKLTVKELLRSCDINSGVGNGISGNGKPLSDLHITPGFSPKFNWVGVENCNDEDGLTIAERMKFTDKRKKFTNSQGKQHGEAGNSFSHFECLSSSTSDNGPVRKLWKKDVAKGVADCERDSNSSRQSSKSSKRCMSGNNASVPPGFPPKCIRVNIEDSDEEDKLTVKELLRSCNINKGVVNRISGDGKPLSDATSHVLSSLTTDNGKDRMIESLMEAAGKIMHGEVVIVNAEGSMEDATERKEECEALSMEGINVNEGERSRSCAFEMPGLEIEARIHKLEKVTAERVKSNKVWLQV